MQIIINGVISGLLIAMVAMSFSLVYLPTRVFHIALAGILTAAPFVAMAAMGKSVPAWAAMLLALLVAGTLSVLCELLNHRRLERRRASAGAHMVSSIGNYLILNQAVAILWGNESHVLRSGIEGTFHVGAAVVTQVQGWTVIVSLIVFAGLFAWLRFTNHGLRLRALADNPVEFALLGYSVDRHRLFSFGLSGLVGATAALLMAYDVGFDPHGGLYLLLLGVVAVIIGGRGSFLGPVVAGLLLGVLRAQVVWHLSARWQDVITFLILAGFLYVRPSGICGHASRLEADQ